ncbi:MAG: hypothetical protein QM808_04390 [Steroidobacteraceae bacterium]
MPLKLTHLAACVGLALQLGVASHSYAADAKATASATPDNTKVLEFNPANKKGPQGENWASIAKLPDWTGAWGLDQASFGKGMAAATGQDRSNVNMAPLNDKWEAMRMSNGAANGGRGPADGVVNNSNTCIPNGMPGLMGAPFAFQFIYTPGEIIILPENNSVRRIFTDGRKHPADGEATFNGHSIGYWENNVLVVETVNMKNKSEYFMGLKTSGTQKIVERLYRESPKKFRIDFTVTDSVAFTKPWNFTRTYDLSEHGMVEYYCTENNRDSNGFINLTPPPV